MAFNPNKYKQTSSNGVWTEYLGGKFIIAKSGTARHVKIQADVFDPVKHLMNLPSFKDDDRKKLYAEVVAKSLLVGWRDMVDDDGNEIPYSVEAAQEMVLEIPELLEFVTQFSINHANYRAQTVEETAKKFEKRLTGTESGAEKTSKKT